MAETLTPPFSRDGRASGAEGDVAVRGAKRQRPAARAYGGRAGAVGVGRGPSLRLGQASRTLAYRLCYALVGIGLAAALWYLLGASTFRIERLDIKGNYLLSREEIAQASGALGVNAFSLDKRRVAAAITGLGVVQKVDVGLALPNALTIRVVEYQPRYVWMVGQQSYLVDERGVVLARVDAPPPLPGLKAVDGTSLRRGDTVNLEALKASARLRALWPSRLGERPALELAKAGLALNGGEWRADLGEAVDLEAKLLALAAVLDRLGPDSRPSYVDLRIPERPYFK